MLFSERSDDDVFPHQSVPGIGHMTNYVQSGGKYTDDISTKSSKHQIRH